MKIVKVIINNFEKLTEIAFEAKKHWNYPNKYIKIWQNELTITKDYIKNNIVYLAKLQTEIVGFYSIVYVPKKISGKIQIEKGHWLEHIFIKPKYHNKGIGTQLIEHAKNISKFNKIKKLFIFVDPYAEGFYTKIGAKFLRESPSSIKKRKLPVYVLNIM